jgi:hypothetical protein
VQEGQRIKTEQCNARDLVQPQAGVIGICAVIRADFADKGQATGRNAKNESENVDVVPGCMIEQVL